MLSASSGEGARGLAVSPRSIDLATTAMPPRPAGPITPHHPPFRARTHGPGLHRNFSHFSKIGRDEAQSPFRLQIDRGRPKLFRSAKGFPGCRRSSYHSTAGTGSLEGAMTGPPIALISGVNTSNYPIMNASNGQGKEEKNSP
jgi:hypothetical protein